MPQAQDQGELPGRHTSTGEKKGDCADLLLLTPAACQARAVEDGADVLNCVMASVQRARSAKPAKASASTT